MAVRAAISIGFPGANCVVELGQRDSIPPGEFIVEGGQPVVTVVTGQVDNLTLAATGQVIVAAASSPTIASPSLSAVGNIAITASLTKTIDPITLAASGKAIVSASLDATIDEITSAATGLVIRTGGDVAVPWWFEQYKARIEAERKLETSRRREVLARELDGFAVMPPPTGDGRLQFDIDTYADLEYIAGLAPWLLLLEPA